MASEENAPIFAWRLREVNGRLFALGDGATIASLEDSGRPFFTRHPSQVVASGGEAVSFNYEAVDPLDGPLTIQWLRNGDPLEDGGRISGSQSPVLEIANVTPEDESLYSVCLSNAEGETCSNPAMLWVRRPIEVSLDFDPSTPGWGIDRFASIQAAIDSVMVDEFASIVVMAGIYPENITFNGRRILLQSEDPADWDVVTSTIIDGGENGSVVRFEDKEDSDSILRGLTIRNGKAHKGGGIFLQNAGPRIEGNWIVDNIAEAEGSSGHGGGIYYVGNLGAQPETLHILGNLIQGNAARPSDKWAGAGGGIDLLLGALTEVLLEGNSIIENEATWGGGVNFQDGSSGLSGFGPLVRRNVIAHNTGSGIMAYLAGLDLTIQENEIKFNVASAGGGISLTSNASSSYPGALKLLSNWLVENVAGTGGGLLMTGSSRATVEGNFFIGNSASTRGGGAYLSARPSFPIAIGHATFVGNQAPEGAAVAMGFNPVSLQNSIVASNTGDSIYSPSLAVSYSNFWGNSGVDDSLAEPPAGTNGNISLDPLFADAEGGDFRLRSQVGRWDPAASNGAGDWTTDAQHSPSIAAGKPDENGDRPNMGAYGLTDQASLPLDVPLVSLSVLSPGYLDKATGQAGEVVLSRSGPVDDTLSLTVTLGGSAEENVDYEVGGALDLLAMGEAVKKVQLIPLPPENVRGDRLIALGLEEDSTYSVGLSAEAELPVYDLPYFSWVAEWFSPDKWEDPSFTDPLADPNGTGLPNLMRFAFAIDGEPLSDRLPLIGLEGLDPGEGEKNFLTLNFTRPARWYGIDYIVEAAPNLVDWEPVGTVEINVEPRDDGAAERVTIREEEPLGDDVESRFLRVKVQLD